MRGQLQADDTGAAGAPGLLQHARLPAPVLRPMHRCPLLHPVPHPHGPGALPLPLWQAAAEGRDDDSLVCVPLQLPLLCRVQSQATEESSPPGLEAQTTGPCTE